MAKITYVNKETINPRPNVADKNKVTSNDMNEIKSVVNENYDNIGPLSNLKTTDKSNIVNAINEVAQRTSIQVLNQTSSSTTDTYSANFINGLNTYSTTEQRIGTWIDGKPLYRKVLTSTLPTGSGNNSITFNGIYITNYRGSVKSRYSQWWPLHNYYASDTGYNISSYLSENRNEINIDCGSHFTTSSQYEITIEYTKTSD